MVKIAQTQLARPFSNVGVERTNKFLKNIITSERCNLK